MKRMCKKTYKGTPLHAEWSDMSTTEDLNDYSHSNAKKTVLLSYFI